MKKQSKKSKKQNMDINYLDLIPVRSEELHWHKDIKGRVILDVENTSGCTGNFYLAADRRETYCHRDCGTGEGRIWGSSRTAVSENYQIFPDC